MEALTEHIVTYLQYINKELGLNTSIHFCKEALQTLPWRHWQRLSAYNSHNNPYCMIVKGICRDQCICEQQQLYTQLYENDCFFKVCHAGVYEYIHLIRSNRRVLGFIAVSGFRTDTRPPHDLTTLWKQHLNGAEFPKAVCDAVIPPLCIMLGQLLAYSERNVSEQNAILQYINEYHTTATLDDLCEHFQRSRSYISHMFKKTYGSSVSTYCNALKLEDARKLLVHTDLSVTEIAFDVGFRDVSYFISLFRQHFGISPLRYRKQTRPV